MGNTLPQGDAFAAALEGLRPFLVSVMREAMAESHATGPTHFHTGRTGKYAEPAVLPPGMTPRSFLDAIASGALVASKVGRRWVVSAEDMAAYFAAHRSEAKPIATTAAPVQTLAGGWTRKPGAR